MILGIEAGAKEAAGCERKILAVLAPRVAVNDGEGEDLFAAIRREEGIEGLRGLDFAVGCDLGLFGLFLGGGVFFGEFGGGKGFGKNCRISSKRVVSACRYGASALVLPVGPDLRGSR